MHSAPGVYKIVLSIQLIRQRAESWAAADPDNSKIEKVNK